MQPDNSNRHNRHINCCYLCGEELNQPSTKDHVPPKQLFAKKIRKIHNPQLLTLPVHDTCNFSYQHDEDYFVHSMSSLAGNTYAGRAVLEGIFAAHFEGKQRPLVSKIRNEWESRPSGLVLPPGRMAKRIEGERVHRVAWKIVRGLFFYHEGRFVPEDWPTHIDLVPPGQRPPDPFLYLAEEKTYGSYPGVFDYRYKQVDQIAGFWFWALLFWDAVIILFAFHDPDCDCAECKPSKIRVEHSGKLAKS